jgi:hypothetical protein
MESTPFDYYPTPRKAKTPLKNTVTVYESLTLPEKHELLSFTHTRTFSGRVDR